MTALTAVMPALGSTDTDLILAAADRLIDQSDPYVHGMGLFMRAATRENAGDPDMSSADAREAYRAFELVGDHWGMGMAAQGVGQWEGARGGSDARGLVAARGGAPRAGRCAAGRPQHPRAPGHATGARR